MLRKIETIERADLEPIEQPGVVSGFQSPAADYAEERLNILQKLITDPTNTYFFESESDSMALFGIRIGTLLVVNRAILPTGGMIVVAWYDGKWRVRQLISHGKKKFLTTAREEDPLVEVSEANGMIIWGVVTWSCCPQLEIKKYVRPRRLQ